MLLGVAGIIKPKDVEFAEGECDDCGDYCVCDIHLPSGETIYFETHFGETNFLMTGKSFSRLWNEKGKC